MTIPRSIFEQLRQIIPPLNGTLHKGQSGRVGVLGGAKDYTAGAIKSYSPDLIVHPILDESTDTSSPTVNHELSSLLDRLHVLVLGPGLGREDYMISYAKIALASPRIRECL